MRLALFDIDGTLLTGTGSERRFYLYLLRNGLQGPRQVLASAWFTLRWAPRYGRHVFKKNKAYLSGLAIDRVAALARRWADEELEPVFFGPCLSRLRQHLESGDRVALLSGTPDFLADAIGRRVGVSDYVGSVCATRGDRFGEAPPHRHPFGRDKALLARSLSAGLGVEAADVIAYGDSSHDLALLSWAGQPVAVRPDPGLRRIAMERGWEILGARGEAGGRTRSLSAPEG